MAYFSASEPLPQNSLMPPPAWKSAASNARLARNAEISRTGRERAYANLPTLEDLASVGGLGLATAARWAIDASEQARQAILIGVGDPIPTPSLLSRLQAGLSAFSAEIPQVLSLNGSHQVVPPSAAMGTTSGPPGSAQVFPTMPQAAPVPMLGVYLNPAFGKGPMKAAKLKGNLGPGCGMSGFNAPWGDAFASSNGSQAGNDSGVLGWIQSHPWLAAGVVGLGLFAATRTRKGRGF